MNTSFNKREELIPIKNLKCKKVLILGTTGAGKTTLLRQFIGTDPDTERFPSTSTSRTTIHDIEIYSTDVKEYEAIVTFLSKEETKNYIEDCVSNAIIQYIKTNDEEKMMNYFLFHENMKFRLGYIIGKPIKKTNLEDFNKFDFEFEDEINENKESNNLNNSFVLSDEIQTRLSELQKELKHIAIRVYDKISDRININPKTAAKDDNIIFFEQQDKAIKQDLEVDAFIEKVLEIISQTFKTIHKEIKYDENWLHPFYFKTEKRKLFIETINKFSSNNANDFGRLLTPVVSGIRIKGRFLPNYHTQEEFKEFVFFDGEGLGHNVETSVRLSGSITNKFSYIDAILLVDNAEQPMQASSIAVLKDSTAAGVQKKLVLAFTHFDQVKGDNFSNTQDKIDHITFTINNVLNEIGKERGKLAQRSLEETVRNNLVFLSGIQSKKLGKEAAFELRKLMQKLLEKEFIFEDFDNPTITFSSTFLENSIIQAIKEFRDTWNDYFGFSYQPKFSKVHWTALKAYTKRVAYWKEQEYGILKPIEDLKYNMNTFIGEHFLENAIKDSHLYNDEIIEDTISKIKNSLRIEFSNYFKTILIDTKTEYWADAYSQTGAGSSQRRANIIQQIFNLATLKPQTDIPLMKPNPFVENVKTIVRKSIENNNCTLI